jgi:hypothetical protein
MGGGVLNEYAVGKNGDVYPPGSGRLMKAGSRIRPSPKGRPRHV